MSLRIRLSRGGAKKRPFYRIVVADSRRPRDGRFIERIGTYNPMVAKDHPDRLKIDDERIKYWLGVGAKPSDRIARFLGNLGIMEKPPMPEQTKQHLPRAKTIERQKEAEEAAKKAAEAPKEDKPEQEKAEDKPAEDKPEEDKPEEKAEEAPAEEKPEEDKPAEDKPEEKAEEKPEEDKPAEDKPEEKAEAAEEKPDKKEKKAKKKDDKDGGKDGG